MAEDKTLEELRRNQGPNNTDEMWSLLNHKEKDMDPDLVMMLRSMVNELESLRNELKEKEDRPDPWYD